MERHVALKCCGLWCLSVR